ncbi:DUF1918 domain-containing protein [Luteolibacter arcticus]|uniref:DUF1918 domain-containing protein n=1 Tax=Luteolibacter arcticus TaxID=1581411 RepID=A0ABT3GS28_9BACT|nr:DUF1918 domain-containing protein [Luteolibacter arcticus]MCW1926268.1 DUF1918 domain-containing protein [Luteolibacter arcticus]
MHPRPFYRWRSFGFGLLALGFLACSWIVSMDTAKGLWVRSSSTWWGVMQFEGEVGIFLDDRSTGGTGREVEIVNVHGTGGSPLYRERWEQITANGIVVPHWLLILCFLVPWSAFLIWRGRRMRRLAAGIAEPLDGISS